MTTFSPNGMNFLGGAVAGSFDPGMTGTSSRDSNIALAFAHLVAGDHNIEVRILNPSLDPVSTDFVD